MGHGAHKRLFRLGRGKVIEQSEPAERLQIGAPALRIEDRRLVTGRGRFTADVTPHRSLHAAILRSTVAAGRIVSIDTKYAKSAPGVVDVFTGEDLSADAIGDLPCASMPPRIVGTDWKRTDFPALAKDRIVCVGECIAMVVAESRFQAQDALELIDVVIEEQQAVVDLEDAMSKGEPLVHAELENNFCYDVVLGNGDKIDEVFAKADHVVEIKTKQPRVYAAPLEPRSCIGEFDEASKRYSLNSSLQNPHSVRRHLANVFDVPANNIHVITGDVGGSFGLKGRFYPEDILVLWAAKRLGRAVKWRAERTDSFLGDFHGRDQEAEGRLALDKSGRIKALDVTTRHNVGSRLGPATGVSPALTPRMIVGPYRIPTARVRAQAVFTNTRPTTSYRGAGRPEATYFIERLMDKASHELGISPSDLRRKNLITKKDMPYRTAIGDEVDCGDLVACLEKGIELSDWNNFEIRRAASENKGRLRGRGLATFMEVASISNERMEIRFNPSGTATIIAGTCSHGQGHETVFTQMVSEWLGLGSDQIGFLQGDTDVVSYGGGTYASRSIAAGGSALKAAADRVIENALKIAAWKLDVGEEKLSFVDGVVKVKRSNRSISLSEIAQASYAVFGFPEELGQGLSGVGYYQTDKQNFPNGCHIIEVEIDKALGTLSIDKYIAVDDVGRVMNPALLEGQLHGSIAQGIGQALLEEIKYDEHGQLLTAAFTEYAMPKAEHMPIDVTSAYCNHPTKTNPLGAKGGAEVGTIGAPPALVAAVNDALQLHGDAALTLPITHVKIFENMMSQPPDIGGN